MWFHGSSFYHSSLMFFSPLQTTKCSALVCQFIVLSWFQIPDHCVEYTLLTSEATFCISIVNSLGFGRTAEKRMAFFPQLLPMSCLKSHCYPGLREIKRMLLKIRSTYFASLIKRNKQNPTIQNDTDAFLYQFAIRTQERKH